MISIFQEFTKMTTTRLSWLFNLWIFITLNIKLKLQLLSQRNDCGNGSETCWLIIKCFYIQINVKNQTAAFNKKLCIYRLFFNCCVVAIYSDLLIDKKIHCSHCPFNDGVTSSILKNYQVILGIILESQRLWAQVNVWLKKIVVSFLYRGFI